MTRNGLILLVFGAVVALALAWILPRLTAPQDRFTVALNLIADGRGSDAVHLLEDRVWRGIAEYRTDRFRRATAEFIQDDSIVSVYNLGTAYARLGEWSAARAAYERVLDLDPGHEDAAHNLLLVLQAEARQQEEQEGQRQSRTLGAELGAAGNEQSQGENSGDQTTTREARPSEDTTPSETDTSQAGQIAASGRIGDEALSENAAAGRGAVTETADREAAGRQGAGGMRPVTRSARDAEILLRAIKDDPERVLAARLRAMHRLRQGTRQ